MDRAEQTENKTGIYIEKLAGTKTEQNLHTSLSAESQAYLRYLYFKTKAKTDGYIEISKLFDEIALNEKEHAEIWFKLLGGASTTQDNLSIAASGEKFEWSEMYYDFEKTAREEGFNYIADLFARVASVEKEHEKRYLDFYEKMNSGSLYSSNDTETEWICLNCGYVVKGKQPPLLCPTCSHPQGYFKKNGSS